MGPSMRLQVTDRINALRERVHALEDNATAVMKVMGDAPGASDRFSVGFVGPIPPSVTSRFAMELGPAKTDGECLFLKIGRLIQNESCLPTNDFRLWL